MFPKLPAYKNLVLTIFGLVSMQIAIAQTNTWDGSASNDWNTPANWSLNVVPTQAHNVVIGMNAAIIVSASPGTIKSLTITNNSVVSLTAGSTTKNLVIRNNNALAFEIQVGSTFSLLGATGGTGGQAMSILYYGVGNLVNIFGEFVLGGGGAGGIYRAANSVTSVTGTVTHNNGTIISTDANLFFFAGSTYVHNVSGSEIPTATWDGASTILLTGLTTGFPTNLNQIFGNMTIQSNLTRSIVLNTDLFLSGNFTVNNPNPAFRVRLNGGANDHTMTVGGDFTLTNGSFELVRSTGAGNLDIGGNLNIDGGLFIAKNGAGPATVTTGGGVNITGGTLEQRRSGGSIGNSVINVTGNYTQTGGIYRMNSTANEMTFLNLIGNFIFTGGTIDEIGAGTSNGLIVFAGSIQEFTSGGTITPGSIINYYIFENVTLQFTDATTVVTGAGSFETSIGSTLGVKHPQGISIAGSTGQVQVTGTRTYAAGANYIYNGTTDQVAGTGLTQNTANFLTIDNPGNTISLSGATEVSADLVISSGTFSAVNGGSDFDLTIGGEFVNNGAFTPGTAKVVFNGGGVQTISGSTPTTFNVLELAKGSGSVALGQDVNVSSALNIDVILDLMNFNLIMGNTAQNIGTLTGTLDETKMIVSSGSGQLRKSATSAAEASYLFPVGDITGTPEFSPVGILFTGGTYSGYVGVTVVNEKHPNNLNITDFLNRYWNIDQSGFSGFSAQVGFNFVPADVEGAVDQVRLGLWEGAEPWIRFETSLDEPLNLLTATVTEFDDFTGLSVSEALPIHFGSIRGWAVNNNAVAVEWKILGETGTSHYEVEKLQSANNFVKIGSQNASNSGLDETYTYTDIAPGSGDNFYRIKGIELTGEITYSPVVRVKLSGSTAREMKVYPNPIKGSTLAVSLQNFKSGKYEVFITNNSGQVIYRSRIDQAGPNTILNIPLNSAMSKGIYRLKITNGEDTYLSSFIKE